MFDGIDRFSMLGASGNPEVPGLGFRYDQDERWRFLIPPAGMACSRRTARRTTLIWSAVEAFAERKYGTGGPFNSATPGAWSDSPGFRGSAQVHDAEFKACVALQAQYVFDSSASFGTVPTIFIMNYVQPTIWTSSSTTDSSSRAHTCVHPRRACSAGTVNRRQMRDRSPNA